MAGQVWNTNNLGGFMYSLNLSKVLRTQLQPLVKFRQFCDVKDASQQGKKKGDIYHWNVYSDLATAGGALTETAAMPESNFTISQGSLTITEYGIAVPFTEKLDNLSEHPVKEIINKVLKNDARKTLDKAAYDQFAATPLCVAPVGGTDTSLVSLSTTGSTAIVNNVAMTKVHVRNIVDGILKERNIPPYIMDDYVCIGRPSTFSGLKGSLESLKMYTETGFGQILSGEIGRYNGCRFVEQGNVAAKGWTNGKSDEAFFFGEDTVAEAIAVPEEIRGKIPTDYGRSMGVAWYYVGGFGLVHTQASQARIVKWSSAS
jgi:N4-gp56 family major capsid protein